MKTLATKTVEELSNLAITQVCWSGCINSLDFYLNDGQLVKAGDP